MSRNPHIRTRLSSVACLLSTCLVLLALPAAAEDEKKVDPKFREAVRAHLLLQGSPEQMGISVAYSAANETLNGIAQTGAQVTEPMQQIVLEQAMETYGKKFGDIEFLTDIWVPIYAEHYTEKEIRELIKFYESPLGKKSLEVAGPINEGGMLRIQEAVFAITPGFQHGVQAKLEAAGISFAPGAPGTPGGPAVP